MKTGIAKIPLIFNYFVYWCYHVDTQTFKHILKNKKLREKLSYKRLLKNYIGEFFSQFLKR